MLVVPGLGGSGPEHWQSIWEARNPGFRRVEQRDWNDPDPSEREASLKADVREAEAPVVLVAHSLSCSLVARWASGGPAEASVGKVAASLLVSPADVDSEERTPPEARRFAPMPLAPLPFRTVVVASATDPYVDGDRACLFARCWMVRRPKRLSKGCRRAV